MLAFGSLVTVPGELEGALMPLHPPMDCCRRHSIVMRCGATEPWDPRAAAVGVVKRAVAPSSERTVGGTVGAMATALEPRPLGLVEMVSRLVPAGGACRE